MKLGERVKQRRIELNMTRPVLSKKVGIPLPTLVALEERPQGTSKFSSAIADALGVSLEWLMTGKEPVKIPAYSIQTYEDINELSSEHTRIPVYQIELSAGTGAAAPEFVETLYELPFRLDWVLSEGVKPENVKIMKVKGDSMLTTLGDGDKVLLDVGNRLVEDNRVYAIVLNDDVYVKRLFRTYNGGMDIVSDNEDFDKVTIPPDELHYVYIIGRVFHKMGNSGL